MEAESLNTIFSLLSEATPAGILGFASWKLWVKNKEQEDKYATSREEMVKAIVLATKSADMNSDAIKSLKVVIDKLLEQSKDTETHVHTIMPEIRDLRAKLDEHSRLATERSKAIEISLMEIQNKK